MEWDNWPNSGYPCRWCGELGHDDGDCPGGLRERDLRPRHPEWGQTKAGFKDEECVPHRFEPSNQRAGDGDHAIWCDHCAYHRDHAIHSADVVSNEAVADAEIDRRLAQTRGAYRKSPAAREAGCSDADLLSPDGESKKRGEL